MWPSSSAFFVLMILHTVVQSTLSFSLYVIHLDKTKTCVHLSCHHLDRKPNTSGMFHHLIRVDSNCCCLFPTYRDWYNLNSNTKQINNALYMLLKFVVLSYIPAHSRTNQGENDHDNDNVASGCNLYHQCAMMITRGRWYAESCSTWITSRCRDVARYTVSGMKRDRWCSVSWRELVRFFISSMCGLGCSVSDGMKIVELEFHSWRNAALTNDAVGLNSDLFASVDYVCFLFWWTHSPSLPASFCSAIAFRRRIY